jgi:hypothetical protein
MAGPRPRLNRLNCVIKFRLLLCRRVLSGRQPDLDGETALAAGGCHLLWREAAATSRRLSIRLSAWAPLRRCRRRPLQTASKASPSACLASGPTRRVPGRDQLAWRLPRQCRGRYWRTPQRASLNCASFLPQLAPREWTLAGCRLRSGTAPGQVGCRPFRWRLRRVGLCSIKLFEQLGNRLGDFLA